MSSKKVASSYIDVADAQIVLNNKLQLKRIREAEQVFDSNYYSQGSYRF